jgi:hypothetical protein
MDWKEYEREIEKYFRSEYPTARIAANAHLVGRHSKTDRQIDLLIEIQVCDVSFRIVIDAKHHARKIDVKHVEEFLGLMRDVSAHKGLMIAPEGFTSAAIERAHSDDADVLLDVLNFKDLAEFQGLSAIPYSGINGALIQPPFGWIVDGTRRPGTLAWLYQRGLTIEQATKAREFMYVNFWRKDEAAAAHDLQTLFAHQESYMRGGENPVNDIDFIDGAHRTDGLPTAIRIARFKFHPGMAEYTGFIDFEGFIFMCVLFAPNELAEKNLSKLRFVIRTVVPLKVTQESNSTETDHSIT